MSTALFSAGRPQRGTSLLKVVMVLFVVLFVIFGIKLVYQKVTYKPPYRQAGDQFMSALTKDDASASYALFSNNLKKEFSNTDWKQQVDSAFGGASSKAKYAGITTVSDAQNQYGSGADPQQLKYTLTLKGKNYAVYLTVFYEKSAWKVDQFNTVPTK
ncbi:MAG TPA: hypothetical protein VJP80_07645 [Candidatus Saccharimonadales bacterium]|nr:hypothetical protein [Candidatus Saccharimonadales bacterium]